MAMHQQHHNAPLHHNRALLDITAENVDDLMASISGDGE
jgi:hypothetical protein